MLNHFVPNFRTNRFFSDSMTDNKNSYLCNEIKNLINIYKLLSPCTRFIASKLINCQNQIY